MNTLTIYAANLVLSQLFSGKSYVALLTGHKKEMPGIGYTRQPVSFTAPEAGAVINMVDVNFPVAEEDWGDVAYVALYDAPVGGHCLSISKVGTQNIRRGDVYTMPKGYITIRIPGAVDYV